MKKIFCLLLILPLCLCFYFPCFATSLNNGFYVEGFYTLEKSGFPDTPYYQPLSNPIVDNNFSVPINYSLIAYQIDTGINSASFPYTVSFIYGDASKTWRFYQDSNIHFTCSDSNLYIVENILVSDGSRTFSRYRSTGGSLVTGRLVRLSAFIDTVDNNGIVNRPQSDVSFKLNATVFGYNLGFNSVLDSGDATGVDYYLFPSSAPIPSGSISVNIPDTPVRDLTTTQTEFLFRLGFRYLFFYGSDDFLDDEINTLFNPIVSSSSSSSRPSALFDPFYYNVPFVKLGHAPLFRSDSGSISTNGTISLKDILTYHTGVYSYSQLKLVAVVTFNDTSFISSFDFNPSMIVGSSPVPPTTTEGSVSFPTFGDDTSQFKDLADYLKDLFNTNQENIVRNNNNFIANLMAIPWANFVGTGFSAKLPELSFYLDSLFDSLFDKFTAPTEDQINSLYEDIQVERNSIKSKLAFASDVKAELYFIISTITADNNTVPPRFEIILPPSLFGGYQIRTVDLMSYEIATPYVVGIIKDIITVFLSLGLVLHVWRTLPSTIGNMPRGDE